MSRTALFLILWSNACASPAPSEAVRDDFVPASASGGWERSGTWTLARHRYAPADAWTTRDDGATLSFAFRGPGLALSLDALTVPSYGKPERGLLEMAIDGAPVRPLRPYAEANEVVVARGLGPGEHRVRLVHRRDGEGTGCRLLGFRPLPSNSGDLAFCVTGEESAMLVDARAVIAAEGRELRSSLVRNWLTGACRLAGLPAGIPLTLDVRAAGWNPWRSDPFILSPGTETSLPPIYLEREGDARVHDFKFPTLGHAAVRRPKEEFRARFWAYQGQVGEVKVSRRSGPVVVSRTCAFREDPAAAYYYYKEGIVTLPEDLPPGLYDLEVAVSTGGSLRRQRSPRSVHVVAEFPKDPVFMAFGHFDTWGQAQAEYLSRVVEMANLLAPDMLLISNEVNPAYVAGALGALEVPFVVNFGNHQVYGHERWFGSPIDIVDFGPGLSVLNFGPPWDEDAAAAEKLLAARANVPCKVINAFEPNAPVAELLDRHRIRLIHDGHGPDPKVQRLGTTPTVRVGKLNSESFRLLRFKGHEPVSVSYRADPSAPIPFPRDAQPPVRARYEPANDGTCPAVTAMVTNDLEEAMPAARLTFRLPAGSYRADGGRIESTVAGDDGKRILLTVRVDLPARSTTRVTVSRP